jgi:hypothetical protein
VTHPSLLPTRDCRVRVRRSAEARSLGVPQHQTGSIERNRGETGNWLRKRDTCRLWSRRCAPRLCPGHLLLLTEAFANCSGLRTVNLGLANKGVFGPVIAANKTPPRPTLFANEPTLLCEGLANTPVSQHAVRTGYRRVHRNLRSVFADRWPGYDVETTPTHVVCLKRLV